MRFIEAVTEDYVVAHFLKHELKSERFGEAMYALLSQNGWHTSLLERPDLQSSDECSCRATILSELRGFRMNQGLFQDFPNNVTWARFALLSSELMQVQYVNYSYWNELSGGSRLPRDAAIRIHSGVTVFGMSTRPFLEMAEALRQGVQFPELILVGTEPHAGLVVLEGHARLTAYSLVPDVIPIELTVIAGFSPAMSAWL